MGLLPAYIDKIEELVLAERYTPGQVHAFFSAYASFDVFKHLRKLYLEMDMNSIEPSFFATTFRSISNTALHTLSIQISYMQNSYSIENTMMEIFGMKALRKLSVGYISFQLPWSSLRENSSNIEYLKVHGTGCQREDLQYIFRWAPSLRYLDIGLQLSEYYPITSLLQTDAIRSLPEMSMLHTVLLNIEAYSERRINELGVFFRCMSSLDRLEITIATDTASSISMWESLVQTSLPSINSFILTFKNTKELNEPDLRPLTLTKTPFWTEKQQFHVIIRHTLRSCVLWSHLEDLHNSDGQEWNEVVCQWYIGPNRKMDENLSMLNRITIIALHSHFLSLIQKYHFNNVQHLVINELDDRLLTLITQHINCSRIQHLYLSPARRNTLYFALLESTTNIRSLGISLKQLQDDAHGHLRTYPTVQYLDISCDQHSFNEKDISIISRTFPQLEHLIIRTEDLQYIPLLQTYLPHLHSLTFHSVQISSANWLGDYEGNLSDHSLRQRTRFLFRRNGDWITIWIDQAALADSYWRVNDNTNVAIRPNSGSLGKRMVNRITSLFK